MAVMETTKAQTSTIPHIVDELCLACRKCQAREVCRTKAILQIDRDEAPFIDPSRCYGCRACIPVCPAGAIVVDGAKPATSNA
jgi:MinD superfamily P-loop ATPase